MSTQQLDLSPHKQQSNIAYYPTSAANIMPRYISPSAPLFIFTNPNTSTHQPSQILPSPSYPQTPYPSPPHPKTSTIRVMPDPNIPDSTRAARHAAEKRSWIIKIYCIIAFFDLGIFGLFPNWWAANSLAVVTALLYLGVRYLAKIDVTAQEDDGDDGVELREGVGQSMVAEWMAGDGEGRVDDAEGGEDAEDNDNNDTDNDGNSDDDGGKDEDEQENQEAEDEDRKKAENTNINNIDTCHIYGTRTNIYVTQGGSMHIHVAPGGTFNVNVHEDAAVMEAEREE